MRVKIYHHISKHECETCGGTWHDVYTVRGALGQYENGEYAYCFGTEDGNMDMVVNFLINSLKERGFNIDIPDSTELDNLSVDWETYHNGIDSGIYDWFEKLPDDVKVYNSISDKIDDFYNKGWKRILNSCGYELVIKHTEDEDEEYDYYDDYE